MRQSISKLILAIVHLILYGNFWIAGCAAAMVFQTNFILSKELWSPVVGFVFGGTLLIYGMHRAIGINNLTNFLTEKRYAVIYKFRNHIKVYAVFGLFYSCYNALFLPLALFLYLAIPCAIALLYVLPILKGKKRLRDIDHLKIYLISIAFSWLTVIIPAVYLDYQNYAMLTHLFIERALFIFLITIPFDIRDLRIDTHSAVATIPGKYGLGFAKKLTIAIGLVLIIFSYINSHYGGYHRPTFYAICISTLISGILGYFARPERSDYFYTGLIDGMMLLQFALVLFFG